MSDDSLLLVQAQADPAQFTEYLVVRRRALLGQAKALDEQRAAILQEVAWLTKMTGVKIKSSDTP